MATENLQAPVAVKVSHPGRRLFWLGCGLVLLGLAVYFVQFFALKQFVVPWYTPILGTAGAVAMVIATVQRWTVLRIVGLAAAAFLVFGEWMFLLSISRLPTYAGPEVGQKIPAFATIRADGSPFTNRDLAGQPTVLLFFRGHW
jgi:hypothetical protein